MDDRIASTPASDVTSVSSSRPNITADEYNYIHNHPQFMDTIPQDETGKSYMKQFAALSEGLIPVDGDDGNISEPRYEVLADHQTAEENARRERLDMLVEKKRAEMAYFRLPNSNKRRIVQEFSDNEDVRTINNEISHNNNDQQDDDVSQSSYCRSDDNMSVHSEVIPICMNQRKRARLRTLQRGTVPPRNPAVLQPVQYMNAEHSDSDSDIDDIQRFASVDISEKSDQRMVILPNTQVCNSLPPDQYITQTQMISDHEDEELQRIARERVEGAETNTTFRFLKM